MKHRGLGQFLLGSALLTAPLLAFADDSDHFLGSQLRFVPAVETDQIRPENAALIILELRPAAISLSSVPLLELVHLVDGSTRVRGSFLGSDTEDHELIFIIDVSNLTYTATPFRSSPDGARLYQRVESFRGAQSHGKEGDVPPPLLPEDPPEYCCMEMCSGQHYAYLDSLDPPGYILARTEQTSYWEVSEGTEGRCHWNSIASGGCSVPPQPFSNWFITGCSGSYPVGGYKTVYHRTNGQFINWDFWDSSQSTSAFHQITINRYGGGPTEISFSFDHTGELSWWLSFAVGDSGSNDCGW